MTDYFEVVCSKIEEEKDFLYAVSQQIWQKPELAFKEFQAHALLSDALGKFGFNVKKHYILETAFRAEHASKMAQGQISCPTVAILLEYDALPGIGHACGHNLIAEAGLAAAVAVKEVMDKDPTLQGKLVVMGTPAEELGGGKIKLLKEGAFRGIDAALMVHPGIVSYSCPPFFMSLKGSCEYIGKESHAAVAPWEGINALDAAVMCYNSISVLRQQISPDTRIHVNIKEGGRATNIIPETSRLEFGLRSTSVSEMEKLRSRLEMCMQGAATATGCSVTYQFNEANCYKTLITNKPLVNVYKKYFEKLGLTFDDDIKVNSTGSSDIGNVSHVVPAFHPIFGIPSASQAHTREFGEVACSPTAQKSTLAAAKAMAMTAVSLFRSPDLMKEVQAQFEMDILNECSIK